jgi:hypothetical protein
MGLRTINHSAAGTSMGVFWPAGLSGERSPDTVSHRIQHGIFSVDMWKQPRPTSTAGFGLAKTNILDRQQVRGDRHRRRWAEACNASFGVATEPERQTGRELPCIDGWIPMLGKDVEHVFRWFRNSVEPEGRLVGITQTGERILGRGRKEGTRGQTKQNKTTVRGIPMWSPTIVLTSRYTA